MEKFIKHSILAGFIVFFSASVFANPGDYSLRAKVGPSFSLKDWSDQVRFGADFDYDLGYSLGIGFLTAFGVSSGDFRFQMIPTLRYDFFYIGPGAFYSLAGAGYGRFNDSNSLDIRTGLGLTLPLGDHYEVNSDLNLFFSPAGTPGTPITLDWLIAFGFKF